MQAHKSSKEQRLLSASKAFDQGLSRHNLSGWNDILDPHVILHKDVITLYDDLHGINSVKGYFQVRHGSGCLTQCVLCAYAPQSGMRGSSLIKCLSASLLFMVSDAR